MGITQDLIDYINNVITSIIRGCDYEVALYMGDLYIFADNSVYFKINIQADPSILYGFKKFEGNITPLKIDRFNDIIAKYNLLKSNIVPEKLLYENINVREDQYFNEYNSMKASDGARFMNIPILVDCSTPKIINIPVFPGLPLLSKPDTAGLSVYSGLVMNQYIIRYMIYKKKFKVNVEILFVILDINRPMR